MKKMKSFGGRNLGGSSGIPGGLPKNFAELQRLQVKMEEELKSLEEAFATEEVAVEVGGGAMKIVATCDRQVKDVVYESDVLEDQEMFKDLLKAAISELWQKVDEIREERTNEIIAKYNPLA
ncbi:MAG TPA: YbaB/EbfC family nucleoid-associated protein [Fervidobacterium sp.]|nr:YbaB/EbfC family nucleoid-associated protein [Fervidobacterium sp.]HQE48984.1 YbaB/EbfC family nucleoid-associated protein [Fervidobacterium sp.]HUM42766.1 YbaB/EbfC family nucleoid-associated protein [Fervidobacterium sp.]